MSLSCAIKVEDVTKSFKVHSGRSKTLKDKVISFRREKWREFIALENISFEVPRGSTTALIGLNGSGKSTLLKLMSRIMFPDKGLIHIQGRVSGLLELGAGFHPDFTGRENIFLNASLFGLTRRETRMKLDDIIEFSELGPFIDEPVRNYSSGMYMRLAFSVAVAVEPDILLVDEILAVGDAPFQEKCMNRLKKLRSEEKTIVLVTHDMNAVQQFCDSAVWLHRSRVAMVGTPGQCVDAYLTEVSSKNKSRQNLMDFDKN